MPGLDPEPGSFYCVPVLRKSSLPSPSPAPHPSAPRHGRRPGSSGCSTASRAELLIPLAGTLLSGGTVRALTVQIARSPALSASSAAAACAGACRSLRPRRRLRSRFSPCPVCGRPCSVLVLLPLRSAPAVDITVLAHVGIVLPLDNTPASGPPGSPCRALRRARIAAPHCLAAARNNTAAPTSVHARSLGAGKACSGRGIVSPGAPGSIHSVRRQLLPLPMSRCAGCMPGRPGSPRPGRTRRIPVCRSRLPDYTKHPRRIRRRGRTRRRPGSTCWLQGCTRHERPRYTDADSRSGTGPG